jgi:transmembrane sensor
MSSERLRPKDEEEWIRAEAAEWLVRRSEGGHDQARETAFHTWRLADPRHEKCYAEMAALWGSMTEWDELKDMESLERPTLRERWVAWRTRRAEASEQGWTGGADFGSLGAALAVVVLLVAGPFLLPLLNGQPSKMASTVITRTHETLPGEIREIALEDGSHVTLGAGSRITVSMGGRREVGLLAGEAYFSVAHDKKHPFYVRAKGANVRVVGPEFSVTLGGATTQVAVQTGIVDVSSVGLPTDNVTAKGQVRLMAGDGVVAWQNSSEHPMETIRVDNVGGWRTGRLAYQDAYLADILADISRYVPETFELASPDIGNMRVTASFRADDAAAAVPAILRGLGLISGDSEQGVIRINRAEN